jgi:uncharacterized protein
VITFQQIALLVVVLWLGMVAVRFRHSYIVLIGGLLAIGVFTLASFAIGKVTLAELGLGVPRSWLSTIGFTLAGLGVLLAWSPIADWLASRWFAKPPTLEAFSVIQQSRLKLFAGIAAAWLLGGVLEELIARGIVVQSIKVLFTPWFIPPVATGTAVFIAALGAGLMHSYQGPRAMVVITQLSILFGILFVASGFNLWAVMICHGMYDTIAFVRFATKKSRYSSLENIQISHER